MTIRGTARLAGMNGFIAFGAGAQDPWLEPSRIAPVGDGHDRAEHLKNEAILTWGGAAGDIHTAISAGVSLLVLSGYALELPGKRDCRTQTEAAELLLRMFDDADTDAAIARIVRELVGSFGIFYRSNSRDVTLCVSDRVASRPMWMAWNGRDWLVSSHASAIALSLPSPDVDPTAVGVFLLYGGPIEPTRSVFAGVRAVPAGTIVRLHAKARTEPFSWYRFCHRPDLTLSVSDWVDLVGERLVRAASRLVHRSEKLAVFFSGGVDSRLTAAALKTAGGDPLLVTLGDSRNIEIRVATAAAKALGLRHEVVIRDEHWYLRRLARAVYETGTAYIFTHGHFATAAGRVREKYGVHDFLLGDLGEAFSKLFCSTGGVDGRPWTPEEFAERCDVVRLPLYRPADKRRTLSLFRPAVRAQIEAGIRRETLERYRSVSGVSTDPLIVGDYCFRWESAGTLPTFYMFTDLRSAAAERNIMFDPEVHEILESLPSSIRNHRNFGARLVHRLQPRAAWVPNSNSLVPMLWPVAAHRAARLFKPLLGNARRRLVGDSHRTTGSWPEHAALYVSDPDWRDCIQRVLRSRDAFDDDLFDPASVAQCWDAFVRGDRHRGSDVERLLQIGLMKGLLQSGWSAFAHARESRHSTLAGG